VLEVTKEMPQPSKAESVGIEKRKQMTDSDEEGALSISVASRPARPLLHDRCALKGPAKACPVGSGQSAPVLRVVTLNPQFR
jgi:hypothetical protein